MSFRSAVPDLVSARAHDRRTPSSTHTLAESRVPPERSHKRTPSAAISTGAASVLAYRAVTLTAATSVLLRAHTIGKDDPSRFQEVA